MAKASPPEAVAIEDEEDQRCEEERGLVERSWNRCQTDHGEPAKWPWNVAVTENDPNRTRRATDERSHPSAGRAGSTPDLAFVLS